MKRATTFQRFRDLKKAERPGKMRQPGKHGQLSSWQRARYEQAPEMLGHMLHVR